MAAIAQTAVRKCMEMALPPTIMTIAAPEDMTMEPM